MMRAVSASKLERKLKGAKVHGLHYRIPIILSDTCQDPDDHLTQYRYTHANVPRTVLY